MVSFIEDVKTGFRVAWLPFVGTIIATVAAYFIQVFSTEVLSAFIQETAAEAGSEGDTYPAFRFLMLFLAIFILTAVMPFLMWCLFLTRWLRAEFGISEGLSPSRHFRGVVINQLLSHLISAFVAMLVLIFCGIVMAGAVSSFLPTLSGNTESGFFALKIVLMLMFMLGISPAVWLYLYFYFRYAPGLLSLSRAAKRMKMSEALDFSRENAPPKAVFKRAALLTFIIMIPFCGTFQINGSYMFGETLGAVVGC